METTPNWERLQNVALNARTHAEFLNTVFGTKYKQWYKSVWDNRAENLAVWMVRFYGDNGTWKNRILTEDKLTEDYIGKTGVWDGKVIDLKDRPRRIVVALDDRGYCRTYTIKGLFLLNEDESKLYHRVFCRIA